MKKKIYDIKNLSKIISQKRKDKKIVLCHGVFDLVHIGHIEHFKKAKSLGDILVVTITSDRFINKGPERPYFKSALRLSFLASIEFIDYVSVIDSPSAIEGIKLIKPNIYCKGNDYKNNKKDITNKIKKEIKEIKKIKGKIIYTDEITFSSSKILNSSRIGISEDRYKIISSIKKKYSYEKIETIINQLSNSKCLVLGEIILDEYNFCEPLGKSGKDPIMMFRSLYSEKYAGGTAAIANHVANFAQNVKLISTIGEKKDNIDFLKKNLKKSVSLEFVIKHNSPTIVKKKYIDDLTKNKIIGFYHFNDEPLNIKEESKLSNFIKKNAEKYDFVILADYSHGMISNKIANEICNKAKFLAVNAQINAANSSHHTLNKYSKLDVMIINESELRHELRDRLSSVDSLIKKFVKNKKLKFVVVTSGSKGAILYDVKKNRLFAAPSFTDRVIDKIGSGDAMLSIFSLVLQKTLDPELSIFLGSLVAAQAVQTIGNSKSVDKNSLLKTLQHLL